RARERRGRDRRLQARHFDSQSGRARRGAHGMNRDVALRLSTIALVLGLGALGLAQPDAAITGGVPWLAFLIFALSGFGWFVVRVTRIDDADFGLRAGWGLAA